MLNTCLFSFNSKITGCVSISVFAWLVCVPVGITSSAVELKICVVLSLQELENINLFFLKKKRSMRKQFS